MDFAEVTCVLAAFPEHCFFVIFIRLVEKYTLKQVKINAPMVQTVYVADSLIQGKGLFAAVYVPAGTVIGRIQ